MYRKIITPCSVVATLLLCGSVNAQTFGTISGLVTDTSDAVVVGATITVINQQTNAERTTTSNSGGNYSFPSLPPGVYGVRAELDGFQSGLRSSIQLQVQQTARIDFRLAPGSIAQTVEVSGGAPLLNTENATVGTVIENKRIVDLPLNGRSFVSLLGLSPNVTTGQTSNTGYRTGRGGSDRQTVSVSVAGMRQEYTYYSLDGVVNQDIDWNTYAFLPSIDAVEEFKVQTGIYSAEFGREAAQVNVSTKSGTNNYHGTLFEFFRNNKLDARPYAFTSSVPASAPFKWNQYGFTLGGPVRIPGVFDGTDRLFFMSNYEGFKVREQNQAVYSTGLAPQRLGDFSQLGSTITDPLDNGNPFPQNKIPVSRLDPIAVGMLEFYPEPNVAGGGLTNNYLALQNLTTDKDQFTQRIDFIQSANSSWYGRYSFQNEGSIRPALKFNGTNIDTRVRQAMLSNTYVLSPSLVNEFRFGYQGYHNLLLTELAYRRNVNAELGIPLLTEAPDIAWGTINITITGLSPLGDSINAPYAGDNHIFQWADNISWIHGAHTVRLGAEVRRDRYNAIGGQVVRGAYVVQNQATGYGFSDYMLGYLQSSSAGSTLGNAQLRATSQAYYVNDNWKIRPNVTIEAGVRWEYKPPWTSRGDSFANIVVPFSGAVDHIAVTGVPNELHPYLARDCSAYGQNDFYSPKSFVRFDPAIRTECVSGLGTTIQQNDLTNWAPRLGIAWSPTQNWTLRAGAGVFYVQDEVNTFFDSSLNMAGKAAAGADLTKHDLTFGRPFGNGIANKCGVPSPPYACVSSPILLGNQVDRKTPYIIQTTLNLQRQLTNTMALEVGYVGSTGHRLERALVYNDSYPSPTGSQASRSPFPEVRLIQTTEGVSTSFYHGGTLKLTRRLSDGLSLLASYTFSKSIDDGSGIRPATGGVLNGGGASTHPQGGLCYKCEKSLSDFDTRHRFVVSSLYELPFGRGKRFLNSGVGAAVVGGWQINSIFTASTGFPIPVLVGINRANTTLSNNRPDSVGISPKSDNPTTGQWFNIRAFQLQPFGSRFGNLGRNVVTSPGFVSWDFSTLKNFNFTEQTYLQFRFECFNCANHPAFGDPFNSLASNKWDDDGLPIPGTGNFGAITTTRAGIDMRRVQFSLKFIF